MGYGRGNYRQEKKQNPTRRSFMNKGYHDERTIMLEKTFYENQFHALTDIEDDINQCSYSVSTSYVAHLVK